MKEHAQRTPDRNAARPPQGAGMRVVQRKCDCGNGAGSGGDCGPCAEEKKKKKVQRRAIETTTPEIPDSVDRVLQSSGRPLDHDTRAAMESRFGHDLSRVRVHTDTHAAASAREIHATAYTSGTHIVFADRRFAPHTAAGRHLLAHELAHVVQQKSGRAIPAGVGAHDDAHERAADKTANAVAAQGAAFAPKPRPRAAERLLRRERDEDVPPIVHDVLASPGVPLDYATRAGFESLFHYDFSGVRVHSDDRAAQSAEAVGARAYTVGSHIVLGEAEPPQALLAHELTHVVQQRGVDLRERIETGETHEHTGATLTRPRLQRGFWSTVLDIFLFIPRLFFGVEFFLASQLREYLAGLRRRRGPQRSLFADNMARACVSREREFGPYDTNTKTFLVLDMLDGYVSGSDQSSIITLLRRSNDRAQIIQNVGLARLLSKLGGRNRRILDAMTLTAADAGDALVNRLRLLEPGEIQDYAANVTDPALRESVRRAAALRNITAPVPASATVDPTGTARFRINGIDVAALPDQRSSDPALGSRNFTSFLIELVDVGSFNTDPANVVVGFTPPRVEARVQTVYGPQTRIEGRSQYGRGYTAEDVTAGFTSIRFHECHHGQDWFNFLQANPLPPFTGRVGMTGAQYQQAVDDWGTALTEYRRRALQYSTEVTDCVGARPPDTHGNVRDVAALGLADVATICRELDETRRARRLRDVPTRCEQTIRGD